jgi:tetratricopeptide (TPR) repeat protein
VAAASYVLALNPPEPDSPGLRGLAYYSLGDFQNSRASCEAGRPDNDSTQTCLALTYHRLGRYTDAEAQLTKLEAAGARWAYECARIYAQWGNRPQALEYLEWALRLHNPDLRRLKADPLMDPLRDEPRFQAIEWALKFPN